MESFYGIHCSLNLMLLIFLVLLLEAEPCFDVDTSLSYFEIFFSTILKDTILWVNTWYIYIYIFF